MDIQDLAAFAFLALVLAFPFGSIYLVLKLLDWNKHGRLFSDSWILYLSWLFCSFLVAIFTNGFQHFPVAMFILIFANTLTNALVLWGINRLRKKENTVNDIFGQHKEVAIENKQRIWRTSFLTSVSAVLTVSAIFTVMFFAGNLIERRINPKPKTSFEIYD